MHKLARNTNQEIVRVVGQPATFRTLQTIPAKYKPYLYNFGTAQVDRSDVCDIVYQTLAVDGWTIRNYLFFVKKPHQLALAISRPFFVLHFNLRGTIDMHFADGKRFREMPDTYQLLQFNTGDHISSYLPGIYETFYIDFSVDWVNKLAPHSHVLSHVLSNIAANRTEVMLSPNVVITDAMRDTLNIIRNFSSTDNELSTARIGTKITTLVSLCLMDLMQPVVPQHTADALVIRSITSYIHHNLDDSNLSIAHLASIYGFSSRTLQEFFKKHTGDNIRSYIIAAKMGKASQLLISSNKTVKEIAYELGYAYPGNFTREYKKYFGFPPRLSNAKTTGVSVDPATQAKSTVANSPHSFQQKSDDFVK